MRWKAPVVRDRLLRGLRRASFAATVAAALPVVALFVATLTLDEMIRQHAGKDGWK